MSTLTLLAIGEVLWIVALCAWIVLERRSPTATLAWIFALAWIPLLGVAVYLAVGPRRLHRKRLRYRRARAHLAELSKVLVGPRAPGAESPPLPQPLPQLIALVERAGEWPPARAQRLELALTGDVCYAAMEAAIAAAEHHVHLEFYIWRNDRVGTRLRDLLCEKARQGVRVRLLLDALGSAWTGRRFFRPLREAGGEVAWFNRLSLARLRPGLLNFRTHRKIVVCDGRVGLTGGMNVADEHSRELSGELAWRDTHLLVEGPPVAALQRVFLEDWHFATGGVPREAACFPAMDSPAGGPWVQIVASGPDHDLYAIQKFYFAAIASARERVLIATPYFVPDEPMLAAIATAALRGVNVKLLVPERGDHRLVAAAARTYYADLARAGVRVYEYGPAMLHAKTLVVDRQIAVVGTANMDNRSFRLNFEVVAAVYDEAFAERLAEAFAADLRQARRWRPHEAKRAPLWVRLGESTARLFSLLL